MVRTSGTAGNHLLLECLLLIFLGGLICLGGVMWILAVFNFLACFDLKITKFKFYGFCFITTQIVVLSPACCIGFHCCFLCFSV